jgi:hypothetical protein
MNLYRPKTLYQQPAHMVGNATQYDWASIGKDKLRIVHDHFLHYFIYSLMYELLLLSYIDWCMNLFYCHIVMYLCDV